MNDKMPVGMNTSGLIRSTQLFNTQLWDMLVFVLLNQHVDNLRA